MSKKKILKAIVLVLSALLTASQNTERKEKPTKFDDDPDAYLK